MRPRRPGRCWTALCLSAAAVTGGILLTPAPAAAHAVLLSAEPAPGATVARAPDAVLLRFDEPLVATLSRASVVDPAGRRFTGTVAGETIRVPLAGGGRGAYRVAWTTVSEVDGHTITGRFGFGVGVAVPAGQTSRGALPTPGDSLVAVLRAVEYTVLLLACGLVALRLTARDTPVPVPAVPVAVALLGAVTAVIVAEAALATARLSPSAVADYLAIGVPGVARGAQILLAAATVGAAVARRRLSAVLVAGIVAAVALAGHAADAQPPWLGVAVNGLHLASAGVWAGGILALALVRWRGAWAGPGRALLPGFSRVAPWAFLVSVALGAVQAGQLLGGVGELLHTRYGLTLIGKAALIAAMIPLSILAWRRRPMLRTEAMLAVLVVAAAAALAAYPVIPRQAREAGTRHDDAPVQARVSPYPHSGDLTLGGRAGDTLVGLSLRPGTPGRNEVVAYLAPEPAAGTGIRLAVGGATTTLAACGASCATATVDVRGGQRITVSVGGAKGGTAVFTLPALPAPDAAVLLRRATARMERLDRYRVDEVLSGIRCSYVYARPHRMWLRLWLDGVPQDTVWLDTAMYRRRTPTAPWSPPEKSGPVPVPYFGWQPFRPFVDPTVVGRGLVDGVPVTQVSFFGGHGADPEPVWFTLWIDTAGDRVLRSMMWAPGHFMDDRYYAFDEPAAMPRPPGA